MNDGEFERLIILFYNTRLITHMTTIILSPHLDDAVFSCGGMIAHWRRQSEPVIILTIFAASPTAGVLPPFARTLHDRWGLGDDPPAGRRQEDILACEMLGCGWKHLEFTDCIYRSNPATGLPIISNASDLFTEIQECEFPLVNQAAQRLKEIIPASARVLSPLTAGGHVDHRLTRAAAELLGGELFYYADFPYAAAYPDTVLPLIPIQAEEVLVSLEAADIKEWQQSAWQYDSQISSFWKSREVMDEAISAYAQVFGKKIWRIQPGNQL